MRKLPIRMALAAALAIGISAARASADGPAPVITEALQVLQRYHPGQDPDALRRDILQAITRAVDPLGELLTGEQAEIRQRLRSGEAPQAAFDFRMVDDLPEVTAVTPDSPAAGAGVQPGDVVTQINGRHCSGLKAPEIERLLTCPAGPCTLKLTVLRDDSQKTVNFQPGFLPRPAVRISETWPRGLRYAAVNGLYDNSGDRIAGLLHDWQEEDAYGVLLDLRGAGGAGKRAVRSLAGLFTGPDEHLYSFVTGDGNTNRVLAADARKAVTMPVIALVDGNTSGASELLAAVYKHSAGGVMLVGGNTNGDPLLRETVALNENAELLWIVTRRLHLADGSIYDGRKGVEPDISVSGNSARRRFDSPQEPDPGETDEHFFQRRLGNDAVLQRATDLLLGLKALNFRGAADNDEDS